MILKFIWKVKGYLMVKIILKKGYQNWSTRTSSKCWDSKLQVCHPTQKAISINFIGPLVNNQRLTATKQTPNQEKAMFNTGVLLTLASMPHSATMVVFVLSSSSPVLSSLPQIRGKSEDLIYKLLCISVLTCLGAT